MKKRILIDLNHPAHVHYFRNFIVEMKMGGNSVFVTARDKEVTYQLLDAYGIDYKRKGKGGKSLLGKLANMLLENVSFIFLFLKFKPHVTLSAGSPSLAQISWLFRKPHFALDDTEHARMAKKLYLPFSKYAFTPINYFTDLGSKHVRVNYFTEICYLHKKWFKSAEESDTKLIKPYALLRFVAWEANHDIGQRGIDYESKRELITLLLSRGINVYISGEKKIPEEFQKYQIKIKPHNMHDVLLHASLYVGESATMAAEATVLGTQAIYVNSLNAGSLEDLKSNYGLISLRDSDSLMSITTDLLDLDLKTLIGFREKIHSEKIDFTSFLIWFVETYPESDFELKNNKEIFNRFRNAN
jgi:predicted glycosyltransferase